MREDVWVMRSDMDQRCKSSLTNLVLESASVMFLNPKVNMK